MRCDLHCTLCRQPISLVDDIYFLAHLPVHRNGCRRTNRRRERTMTNMNDQGLLRAALLGYEQKKQEIEAAITDVRRRLGQVPAPVVETPVHRHHKISLEGRARIAEAQRKRWAATKRASR